FQDHDMTVRFDETSFPRYWMPLMRRGRGTGQGECVSCHNRFPGCQQLVRGGGQRLPMLEQNEGGGHARIVESMTAAHILVVDDDPSVRQMIADYLGDNDIRVTALASGREIDETMERDTIDLVVLDLRLPGEDGMEIARKLRETSTGLPIIMLTGRKDEAD